MNRTNEIISVVVPCYNCETHISETLDSFVAQTFKGFVVICINDGSTDGTLSVLKRWKEKNLLNLVIVDKENEGVSATRNIGIKMCKTEYLAFCDSDDLFAPQFLEKLLFAITNFGTDAAYCLLTKDQRRFAASQNQLTNNILCEDQSQTMDRALNNMGQISFDCILYKTDILKRHSILFDCNTKFGEDREFMWKYLCLCKNVSFACDVLYYYRQNPHSATKSRPRWNRTDVLLAVRRVEEYMEERGCPFQESFKKYMFPRCVWSVAKDFARGGNRPLFNRLLNEYDVKASMRITKRDKNFLVRLSSRCYLINPSLFFFGMRLFGS